MALRAYADDLDAATARFVVGLDDAGFVVYGFLYSAAFAAIGLGLLRTGPTWLGWWAVGAGMLGVVTAGLGVVTGDYIPVPFLLTAALAGRARDRSCPQPDQGAVAGTTMSA